MPPRPLSFCSNAGAGDLEPRFSDHRGEPPLSPGQAAGRTPGGTIGGRSANIRFTVLSDPARGHHLCPSGTLAVRWG